MIVLGMCFGVGAGAAPGAAPVPLVNRPWIEARTANFSVFSCGVPQEVYRVALRLEQFRQAYTQWAGAEAVASPPIVVMAYPDVETMKPFLPQRDGKPGNLAGFFQRGADENLIVLALPGSESGSTGFEVIYHEYAHLLFRHNGPIWPLWLHEGMAEIYSTFEPTGRSALIARRIEPHVQLLESESWLPLKDLFALDRDSREYHDGERQGIFYAQSWILTHFLIAGDYPVYRARFGQITRLLRAGQLPEQAFTNALGAPLALIERDLQAYFKRGRFAPLQLPIAANVSSSKGFGARALAPVEVHFRLGKQLLRVGSFKAAEDYFNRALKLAPASPLPYEGLGLLAAERDQHAEALRHLTEAVQRGSVSFLAHHVYGREKYRLTADGKERYAPLGPEEAAAMRRVLTRPVTLMPSFGPAHQLIGFFEMVQGDDLAAAERHLRASVQLEPDNLSYLIALAQVQWRGNESRAARQTLQPLLLPSVDAKLRKAAEDLIGEMAQESRSR